MSSACQTTGVLPGSPSPIPFTATPRSALVVAATQPPRDLFRPTDTSMPSTPTLPVATQIRSATQSGLVSPPTLRAPLSITDQGLPEDDGSIMIGYSAEGREIAGQRFGDGENMLLLVGGMHGGWEINTVELMNLLIEHFQENPADILPDVQIVIVPAANPDGLEHERMPQGRFNGNGVDLNRNWSCDWSREAYWRQEQVDPGARAFSEPESQALANYILDTRPAGVLFYHSAANGVFPGNCGGDHGSRAFGAAYAEEAGYTCCAAFSAYPVSGTAATWADGERIRAADVELRQSVEPEFEQNLRAILVIQEWITLNHAP